MAREGRDEDRSAAAPPMEQSRSANQVQDEPMPASHHDPKGRAAAVRSEETAAGPPAGRPGQGGHSHPGDDE